MVGPRDRLLAAAARCRPGTVNGSPALGEIKPSESGDGYEPWALQVVELEDGKIVESTFFLDTETLFPFFGLPPLPPEP